MFEELEIEELQPDTLKDTAFTPPVSLRCVTGRGLRSYLYVREGVLCASPGITSVLSETATASSQRGILAWRERVGKEFADKWTQERCGFGTFMHGQTCLYDKQGWFDFDTVKDETLSFLVSHPLPFSVNPFAWAREIKEDVAAWIQWQQDVNAETIATELPLLSRRYKIASRIDWFGWIDIGIEQYYATGKQAKQPKGDVQRVLAIVDKKSSRKDFNNPDHKLQVLFYDWLLRENFKSLRGQEIILANWSPRGFKTVPNYKFTPHLLMPKSLEWNNEKLREATEDLTSRIAKFHCENRMDRTHKEISGRYQAGTPISEHIMNTTLLSQLATQYGATLDTAITANEEEEENE